MSTPDERPTLRKAADRDVHPMAPTAEDLAGATPAAEPKRRKEKLVKLSVKVPKALRQTLRDEAERRGISVDALVAILLGDRTGR